MVHMKKYLNKLMSFVKDNATQEDNNIVFDSKAIMFNFGYHN